MAHIYAELSHLRPVLVTNIKELEGKYSKELKSISKEDRSQVGELAVFLNKAVDSTLPHAQLNWLNKFRGLTVDAVRRYREVKHPIREEKLKQIKVRKAIEARKNKSITSAPDVAKPKVTRPIQIIDPVNNGPKQRKIKEPKCKKKKLGKDVDTVERNDPFASAPKAAEKPPTPKKVQQALNKKSMNQNFKIPKKINFNGQASANQEEDDENDGDLENVRIVDPLASILPAMEKPPVMKPTEEYIQEGWGNETPRSPRRPGYDSPDLGSPKAGTSGDNPFDCDDYYECESNFNEYDAVLESTARDLPDREFDIAKATRKNKPSVPSTSSTSKLSEPNISTAPKRPKGPGTGWGREEPVEKSKVDDVDDELGYEPQYDTGYDVNFDDDVPEDKDDKPSNAEENQEPIVTEESTSGSTTRKDAHYSTLGQDDDLDFEDDDSDDDCGNFKRQKSKTEPPKAILPPPRNVRPQNDLRSNNNRQPDSVFKKPMDPGPSFNSRSRVPRPEIEEEDDEAEKARKAQRAARFNGGSSSTVTSTITLNTTKRVTAPVVEPVVESLSDPFSRRSTRPVAVSTSRTSAQSLEKTSINEPSTSKTIPSSVPFRPDQVAAFSNDLLTDNDNTIDSSLFDEPVKKDPPPPPPSVKIRPQIQPSALASDPRRTQLLPDPRKSVADPRKTIADPRKPAPDPRVSDPRISSGVEARKTAAPAAIPDPRSFQSDPRNRAGPSNVPFDPRFSMAASPLPKQTKKEIVDVYKHVLLKPLPNDDSNPYFNECAMPTINFAKVRMERSMHLYANIHHRTSQIPLENKSGKKILDPRVWMVEFGPDSDGDDEIFVKEVQEMEVPEKAEEPVDVPVQNNAVEPIDALEQVLAEADYIPLSEAKVAGVKAVKAEKREETRAIKRKIPLETSEAPAVKVVKRKPVITNPAVLAMVARLKAKKTDKGKISITEKWKKLQEEPDSVEMDQLLNEPIRGEGDIGTGRGSLKGVKRTVVNNNTKISNGVGTFVSFLFRN